MNNTLEIHMYKKHSKLHILDSAISLLAIYPQQIMWYAKIYEQ